jgi:hypothetical protein
MPATKISALTAGGASQATDEYVVARAGDNRKITGADIAAAATSLGIVARLQAASGTITADAPVLNLTQTWNNAGVTFTGLRFNVTDTASNAASLLLDLQVGGTSRFSVKKDGTIRTASTGYQPGNVQFGWSDTTGFINWSGEVTTVVGGSAILSLTSTAIYAINTAVIGWCSTSPGGQPIEFGVFRDAANVMGQRGVLSNVAQTYRIYRTRTDASNYERLSLGWSNSTAIVATEGAGTGTRGNLAFGTAALATTATRGHIMIPSCAGLATGVPADIPTGQVALIFDSTNNKLGVYDGGWIWTAALT